MIEKAQNVSIEEAKQEAETTTLNALTAEMMAQAQNRIGTIPYVHVRAKNPGSHCAIYKCTLCVWNFKKMEMLVSGRGPGDVGQNTTDSLSAPDLD